MRRSGFAPTLAKTDSDNIRTGRAGRQLGFFCPALHQDQFPFRLARGDVDRVVPVALALCFMKKIRKKMPVDRGRHTLFQHGAHAVHTHQSTQTTRHPSTNKHEAGRYQSIMHAGVARRGAMFTRVACEYVCKKAAAPADGRANQALIDRRPPGGRAEKKIPSHIWVIVPYLGGARVEE